MNSSLWNSGLCNPRVWNARSWNGLAFGIIVAVVVQLSAGTDAGRGPNPVSIKLEGRRTANI